MASARYAHHRKRPVTRRRASIVLGTASVLLVTTLAAAVAATVNMPTGSAAQSTAAQSAAVEGGRCVPTESAEHRAEVWRRHHSAVNAWLNGHPHLAAAAGRHEHLMTVLAPHARILSALRARNQLRDLHTWHRILVPSADLPCTGGGRGGGGSTTSPSPTDSTRSTASTSDNTSPSTTSTVTTTSPTTQVSTTQVSTTQVSTTQTTTAATTTTTPPTTTIPASRTLFGTSAQRRPGESLSDAVVRQRATYGGMGAVRLFSPGLPDRWASIEPAVDHAPLVVSFKAAPTAVAAGTYDAYFANWFATAPRDRAIWWTFYHEPEDDITAGAFTAADYRAAWSRLASLAAQADNSQLRATLILMCWTVNPHSGRDWNDYYARGSVQALGWDCYNKGARKGVYQASSALLTNAVATSNEAGLPWGIAEMGSILVTGDAGQGRASWLKTMATAVADKDGQFLTYFDSDIGVDFRLSDTPSSQAWQSVISGS